MSCKTNLKSIIKFRERDLLLKFDTSSINVEFDSFSNSFYFTILCYIEQKIYPFFVKACNFKIYMPKTFRPSRDYGHLKVSNEKVKQIHNKYQCCVISIRTQYLIFRFCYIAV